MRKKFADEKRQKWPIDTDAHVRAALACYNAGAGKDEVTGDEWKTIGNNIAIAASWKTDNKHRLDGGKIVNIEHVDAQSVTDSKDEISSDVIPQVAGDVIILATDGLPNGILMRVRQRAARVDFINGNNREYPRPVWLVATPDARERARAGVMSSEMRHPVDVVVDKQLYYVDRPDMKTAIVDEIHDPDSNGWVCIDRSIRDTPQGRLVADAIKKGTPYGLSTRLHMRRDPKSKPGVNRAGYLHLHTWDDVPNPAVTGAGEIVPLTDHQMAGMSATGKGKRSDMDKFQKALNAYLSAMHRRVNVAQLNKLRVAVCDAMDEEVKDDKDGDLDMSDMSDKIAKADSMATTCGYNSDRKAPSLTEAAKADGQNSFFNDMTGSGTPSTALSTGEEALAGDALTKEDIEYLRRVRAEQNAATLRAAADAKIETELTAAADANPTLKALDANHRTYVIGQVRDKARLDPNKPVADLLTAEADSFGKVVAARRLESQGYVPGATTGGVTGGVTTDPAKPFNQENNRPPVWMEGVDKIIAASDAARRRKDNFDPTSVKKLRAHNMETFISPLIEDWVKLNGQYKNPAELFAAQDALTSKGEVAFMDGLRAATDSTTTSTMYNMPTIYVALLVQSFFETRALQFVEGIGSQDGANNPNGGWFSTGNSGDGRVGRIFKIPVEYYDAPPNGGFGTYQPPTYDGGLKYGENVPIESGTVKTMWLTFGPEWRRIAMDVTKDVVKAMGNGPLNYDVIARHLYHIGADKSRRVDLALMNEICDAADTYGAVGVTGETVSSANNTVYKGGGSVQVNLNPAKIASAAVAATDDSVTYGVNVIGAARLLGPNLGTYFGEPAGCVPLARPQVVRTFDTNGAYSQSIKYPVTVTAPGAAVEGYIDQSGQIQTLPGGGAAATYAVDHLNGVVLFKSGVANSSLVLSTVITVSYSYVTNYDNFAINNLSALSLLAVGETPQMYYSRLFGQLDVTNASMISEPRVRPGNLAIMSANVMAKFTQSHMFYQEISPKSTDWMPTEDFVFQRNGIMGARINAPWRVADKQIAVLARGSTKYAVDSAWELEGPYQAYDPTTGLPVDKKFFYGAENSAIFTPQVTKQDGVTIMNPPSKWIRLR